MTNLEVVRDALAHAEVHGVLVAATRAEVTYSTVYRWRERRVLSGGLWPTDEDIATWREQYAAAEIHRAAHRRWQRRTLARGGPLLVDPTGTVRRLRALQALGHRFADIAQHTPYQPAFIGALALGRRQRIKADTVDRIRAVYDLLSMTVGPSARTRTYARNRGWAPPLAWEHLDIDDPGARPRRSGGRGSGAIGIDEAAVERAVHGDRVHLRPAERAEAVRRLTARRLSAAEIAERLDTTPRNVTRLRGADTTRRSA